MSSTKMVMLSLSPLLLVGAFAAGCVLVTAQESKTGNETDEASKKETRTNEIIRTSQIELVNKNGVPVVVMKTADDGNPLIEMLSAEGDVVRLKLQVRSRELATIQLNDPKGNPVAVMFSGLDDTNGFNVVNSEGAVLAQLYGKESESGLSLRDRDGVKRVGAGYVGESAVVTLFDEGGSPRLYSQVHSEGKATLGILTKSDDIAYKWTSDDK